MNALMNIIDMYMDITYHINIFEFFSAMLLVPVNKNTVNEYNNLILF